MVLGMTMAEIVLLILFTLLLVLSALLVEKEREKVKTAAQLALMEKEFRQFTSNQISDPITFFRDLEIARKKAAQANQLEQQLKEATNKDKQLQAALNKERLERSAAERTDGSRRADRWPPIINLSEAEGYYFKVGSAELSRKFKSALADKVVPKIFEIAAKYPDVNVIEVIGHTDGQIIRPRYSNLDETLTNVLKTGDIASLVPADNAGLGMARAVAVVVQLSKDSRLRTRFPRILPLSGAQVIRVNDTLSQGSSGNVKERRRIEIRLLKYIGPDRVIHKRAGSK